MSPDRPRIGLFITCLVDLFRPSVGFAAVALLERAGCEVHVPQGQTCCGQPAFNSGDRATSRKLALQTIDAFDEFDYIVAPSGSCTGMLRHYAELFDDDPTHGPRVRRFVERCHELTSFLVDVMGVSEVEGEARLTLTYHDSCSGLRELGVKDQPRRLLMSAGANIIEMKEPETCCGFGGTFCVKYPEISTAIVSRKTADIEATGADVLVAGDLGCLLNMVGRLGREGSKMRGRHVAELLAGHLDEPAIGEGS